MTLQKNLSKTMNAIRISRNLTIAGFSEELDISRSAMQELLKGTGNPRMDTIEHIAHRLKLDPLSLLSCSYSQEELAAAILLLQSIDVFSKLPEEKLLKFASFFQELLISLDSKP